ncbi:hypothetical protein EDD37DRAFT_361486 [Exophiala viscosa]|uniref:uncharacterized protein n=1 Tax=Exophiala viscosa TaxID=2486360 RepID=UPI00219253E0|nr:hypothetical protein EDD37DRAFT_361486 [Exophiala viscosa]
MQRSWLWQNTPSTDGTFAWSNAHIGTPALDSPCTCWCFFAAHSTLLSNSNNMVGVARSGGCHTCRRRRVGCDKRRPTCQRCEADGQLCQGYQSYAVFMNRTPEGLQRRQRLEEAILPGHVIPTERDTHPAGMLPSSSSASATAVSIARDLGIAAARSQLDDFMTIYQPTAPENRTGATLVWLREAYGYAQPSLLLEVARNALAANRCAAATGDPSMQYTGHMYYGRALQALTEKLNQQFENCDNQLLAAIRCLMIYEARRLC